MDRPILNIVCWSGGKDSSATIIKCHELGIPVRIVTAEVMYDHENNISGELPEHMDFMKRAAGIFESWGYPVSFIRAKKDYLSEFRHIIRNATKYPEHNGMMHGFPLTDCCSIRRDLKINVMRDFLRDLRKEYSVVEFIGYCTDEPKRLARLSKPNVSGCYNRSILAECGMTQQDARKLCEAYGLLSPCYKYSRRGGCWMCPYSRVSETEALIRSLGEEKGLSVWKSFVELENLPNLAFPKWNIYGETLADRDRLIRERNK